MSNTTTPTDPWRDHPIVDEAEASIRAFAVPGHEHEITRDQAAGVLRWWKHHHELTEREITAILARFPDTSWTSGGADAETEGTR